MLDCSSSTVFTNYRFVEKRHNTCWTAVAARFLQITGLLRRDITPMFEAPPSLMLSTRLARKSRVPSLTG